MATAVELNVPVLWVLFNNFCYSTIRTVGTPKLENHSTFFQVEDIMTEKIRAELE